MKLINLDNLVLIGPGSEWFWSAVSAVVVAITLIAIYRQLLLQRSAAAVERVDSLFRDWSSERMSRSKLEVLLAIKAKVAPLDVPEMAATEIGDFWDRIGYLVRNGHMDKRLVHSALSRQAQQWWGRLLPSALAWRERDGTPDEWQAFEWLAQTMAEIDRAVGTPQPADAEYLASHLDETIALMRRAVDVEEALRTVPVQLTSTPLPISVVRETA